VNIRFRHAIPQRRHLSILCCGFWATCTLVQKRNRALILPLLSTGARSSEVLRLNRSEWDRSACGCSAKATMSASSK
jgi:integrase